MSGPCMSELYMSVFCMSGSYRQALCAWEPHMESSIFKELVHTLAVHTKAKIAHATNDLIPTNSHHRN